MLRDCKSTAFQRTGLIKPVKIYSIQLIIAYIRLILLITIPLFECLILL